MNHLSVRSLLLNEESMSAHKPKRFGLEAAVKTAMLRNRGTGSEADFGGDKLTQDNKQGRDPDNDWVVSLPVSQNIAANTFVRLAIISLCMYSKFSQTGTESVIDVSTIVHLIVVMIAMTLMLAFLGHAELNLDIDRRTDLVQSSPSLEKRIRAYKHLTDYAFMSSVIAAVLLFCSWPSRNDFFIGENFHIVTACSMIADTFYLKTSVSVFSEVFEQ